MMGKISVVMRKHNKKVSVPVIAKGMVTQNARKFGMTQGTEIAIFEWGMMGYQGAISKDSVFKGTTLYAIAVKNLKGDWIAQMGSMAFLWDTVKRRFEGATGLTVSEPKDRKLR
jgi:hypothetical protein